MSKLLKSPIKAPFIDPADMMRLESARGLVRQGIRPSVMEYNRAVLKKKLYGKVITVRG